MGDRPSVLLIGYGPTAFSALSSLIETTDVKGVFRKSTDSDAVEKLGLEFSVPVFMGKTPKEIAKIISQEPPDCVVLSSYDRILPEDVLRKSRFLNVHYAPLPRNRGRANVNWAIINGDDETAITIHEVAPGLDAGNILFQETVSIGPKDTVS